MPGELRQNQMVRTFGLERKKASGEWENILNRELSLHGWGSEIGDCGLGTGDRGIWGLALKFPSNSCVDCKQKRIFFVLIKQILGKKGKAVLGS